MNPTVLILAAGLSTRYGRLKQLEPLGPAGEALLDYAAFDAWRAGFSRVVLVIRKELESSFREHIRGRWPEALSVILHPQRLEDLPGVSPGGPWTGPLARRRKPWGTAHALLTARPYLRGAFLVLNADDFYGSSAFRQAHALAERLSSEAAQGPASFALVAYRLGDTLSGHGGVNRGLCRVDPGGRLREVREILGARKMEGSVRASTLEGEELILTGDEPVSTNFWIFTPEIFPSLEARFPSFLQREMERAPDVRREEEPGSGEVEFLIPTEVNRLLAGKLAEVEVVETRGPFLGITHPEDREGVMRGLAGLVRGGRYPSPLWGRHP